MADIVLLDSLRKKERIENLRNTIIMGDCLEAMRRMPSESIDLIVTSPPTISRTQLGTV